MSLDLPSPLVRLFPGYNRANYFENLSLKQSRNFRKQQIVGSQATLIISFNLSPKADLFRADVEQAIGASSAVQDRLIVVRLERDSLADRLSIRSQFDDIQYEIHSYYLILCNIHYQIPNAKVSLVAGRHGPHAPRSRADVCARKEWMAVECTWAQPSISVLFSRR